MTREATATELAIDAGHEFIDVAVWSSSGISARKTTIEGRFRTDAVLSAVETTVAECGVALKSVKTIRFSSTDAVNALLAREGGRIALFTTKGFGDCLRLGRQNRLDLYDPVARSPSPDFLVPTNDIHEIAGRLDAAGAEVVPLDEAAVRAAARGARSAGAQAIAVCFLFAHVDPVHELRCAALVREEFPEAEICLSHEVDPQPREYERTVSVCLEAWLRPLMAPAMRALHEGLRRRGFAGRLLFSDGGGVLIEDDAALTQIARLIASGPAAAAGYASQVAGRANAPTAIALDIGSVSLDLMLVRNGRPRTARNATYGGVPLRQDMTDVASARLGGQSSVVFAGGRICFAQGNSEDAPTLNDALIQLGRIGGRPGTGVDVSLRAFGSRRGKADANAIVEEAEREVAARILDFAARRNIDPVAVPIVAMGGLGGILAPGAATLLGARKIILPDGASAAGALGLLLSPSAFRARTPLGRWSDTLDAAALEATFGALARRVQAEAKQAGGGGIFRTEIEAAPDPFMHPYSVALDGLPHDAREIAAAFGDRFFSEFGVRPPARAFIFSVAVTLSATGASTLGSDVSVASDASFDTTAWQPEGWSLTRVDGARILSREARR